MRVRCAVSKPRFFGARWGFSPLAVSFRFGASCAEFSLHSDCDDDSLVNYARSRLPHLCGYGDHTRNERAGTSEGFPSRIVREGRIHVMESEQNFAAIGVSASDTHADQELLPARMISGWDMHPTFLSDADLLGASCVLLLNCMTNSRRLLSCTYRKQATQQKIYI